MIGFLVEEGTGLPLDLCCACGIGEFESLVVVLLSLSAVAADGRSVELARAVAALLLSSGRCEQRIVVSQREREAWHASFLNWPYGGSEGGLRADLGRVSGWKVVVVHDDVSDSGSARGYCGRRTR